MRLGESYKTEIYLIVSIIHGDLLSSPQIQRFTRDPGLLTTSSKIEIWKTLKSFDSKGCAVFTEGFSFRRLTVDGNAIATPYCKATEYAECFVSCDANYFITGKNRWCQILAHFWDARKMTTICLI